MSYRSNVPNLGHLRVFERIAETGSISRAAEMVGRSQPAVTLALRKLEQFSGSELLDRRRSGSYLTDAGSIFLARAQRLFEQIDRALTQPLVGAPFAEPDRLQGIRSKIAASHIRAVIAVTEHETLETAAHSVGLSKPSLYRTTQELEKILGRSLFNRTIRGFAANRLGAELARRFSIALREIDYALEEIEASKGVIASRILIGAMPLCAVQLLTDTINVLLKEYPATHVGIQDGPYVPLLADLRHGRIDFLFGVLRRPDWAIDVVEMPLLYDPYAITVRNGHPLASKSRITLADLAQFDWIMPRQGTPRRLAFDRLFENVASPPSSNIETSSFEFQLSMQLSSDRITLMTKHEARHHLGAGLLTSLQYSGLHRRSNDGIVMRHDWQPTAVQKRFLEILREYASRVETPLVDHATSG